MPSIPVESDRLEETREKNNKESQRLDRIPFDSFFKVPFQPIPQDVLNFIISGLPHFVEENLFLKVMIFP